MEETNDTPELDRDAGLDNALNAAYGEGEESTEVGRETEESVSEESTETELEEESVDVEPETDSEESFTSLDPEKLPDEVKPFYKSMQAAFTKKRQEDSARVAELQSKLEQLSENSKEVQQLNDLIDRARQGDESAFRELMAQQRTKPVSEEERIKAIVKQEREEAFHKEIRSDYPKTDKRLDETSPSYDPMLDAWLKSQMADALDSHWDKEGTSLGFDHRGTAKSLIGKWDKYIVDRNTAYLKRQSEMAKKKAEETKKTAPKTSKAETSPSKKMGLDEAAAAALEKHF